MPASSSMIKFSVRSSEREQGSPSQTFGHGTSMYYLSFLYRYVGSTLVVPCFLLIGCGELETEISSMAHSTAHLDRSCVLLNDSIRDCKPKTSPFMLPL